jgi:DNA repair protein RecN (Recombination protein N)
MLSYLRIRNFGIFKDVELELAPGLTVFTGETGAGKSMLVDAVMACLGQRTPRDLLRAGEERAVIELVASIPDRQGDRDGPGDSGGPGCSENPDDSRISESPGEGEDLLASFLEGSREIILQKDILPDRSYLRLNGRLATSSLAQELGGRLVDIHGQQEHHSLLRPQNYLGILDGLSRSSIEPCRRDFQLMYRERQEVLSRMADLGRGDRERQREIDLLSYQVREIGDAKIRPGEEEELRREFAVLSSQERLVELAERCYSALYDSRGPRGAAFELLDEAVECLKRASSIDERAAGPLDTLQQAAFALEAGLDALRQYRRGLSLDPGRLKLVSDRLDLIQRLKSKYGDSVESVLDYAKKAEARLNELLSADETLSKMKDKLAALESRMREVGESMSALRRDTALRMSGSVTSSLRELGMPGACFSALVESGDDPLPWGYDRVSFLFTANTGEAPMPVHKVASGGELSRLMLAIKSFLESTDPVPTLIFDEIDAGIGGKAGQAVAESLWKLGRSHQVLCVTHLASIAAAADSHYLVSKVEEGGRTHATVRLLSGEERVHEVARMLSGTEDPVSLEHARELLKSRAIQPRG